jgi:hypothetical protein
MLDIHCAKPSCATQGQRAYAGILTAWFGDLGHYVLSLVPLQVFLFRRGDRRWSLKGGRNTATRWSKESFKIRVQHGRRLDVRSRRVGEVLLWIKRSRAGKPQRKRTACHAYRSRLLRKDGAPSLSLSWPPSLVTCKPTSPELMFVLGTWVDPGFNLCMSLQLCKPLFYLLFFRLSIMIFASCLFLLLAAFLSLWSIYPCVLLWSLWNCWFSAIFNLPNSKLIWFRWMFSSSNYKDKFPQEQEHGHLSWVPTTKE